MTVWLLVVAFHAGHMDFDVFSTKEKCEQLVTWAKGRQQVSSAWCSEVTVK